LNQDYAVMIHYPHSSSTMSLSFNILMEGYTLIVNT
jgi:hypothetical protein